MIPKYDVIIIGAGNGGLMAACCAAKMGMKTLVIEKNQVPGGCATSICRGRFEFERSLHVITGFGNNVNRGELRRAFDDLGIKPELIKLDEAYRYICGEKTFNQSDYCVPTGKESFMQYMEKVCPGSAPAVERFFSVADIIRDGLNAVSSFRGAPNMKAFREKHDSFMRLCGVGAEEAFHAIDMPQKCVDILSAYWFYHGADMENIDAVRYFAMLDSCIRGGLYVPKNRSQDISVSLERRAAELGCDFILGTAVTRVKTERGHISGVETSDGKSYDCEAVISGAYPNTVYGKLLDNRSLIPEGELKKLSVREFSGRAFTLLMGLNASAEDIGIKNYVTYITDSFDTKKCFENTYSRERNTSMSAVCLNVINPDASPEGTCMLSLTAMFNGSAWSDVTPTSYDSAAESYSSMLLSRYEGVLGCEIRSHIEEVVCLTPVSFAALTGAPQGAVNGYLTTFWDGLAARNFFSESERSVPGLFFAGSHAGRLSGFYPAYMSGHDAAISATRYIGGRC